MNIPFREHVYIPHCMSHFLIISSPWVTLPSRWLFPRFPRLPQLSTAWVSLPCQKAFFCLFLSPLPAWEWAGALGIFAWQEAKQCYSTLCVLSCFDGISVSISLALREKIHPKASVFDSFPHRNYQPRESWTSPASPEWMNMTIWWFNSHASSYAKKKHHLNRTSMNEAFSVATL